jgi:hypothetical protein
MKRGGFLISKSALNWEEYEGNSSANTALLWKNEIVPMLPGLRVIHHQERPVRNRGVAEYVGRKPEAVNR